MKGKFKISALKLENGKFSGGFTTLDDSQIDKIKGGRKTLQDGNDKCHNLLQCGGDNTGCTNDSQCSSSSFG